MTNNPWIPHKPGDPMPVDGDTVVEFQGGFGTRFPASWIDWKYITAYRIHKPEHHTGAPVVSGGGTQQNEYSKQAARHEKIKAEHKKEREMKYKAGDEVTVKFTLDPVWAKRLSEGDYVDACFDDTHIIAHQPAPEPVVFHFGLRNDGGWEIIQNSKCMDFTDEVHTKITVALNPATKEVKAEVVG